MSNTTATNYFEMYELSCNCGCGLYNIQASMINMLNRARAKADIPFFIVSGCRCLSHNLKIGGATNSAHLRGHAVDIKARSSRDRYIILEALLLVGFNRIGMGKTFIHADNDPSLDREVIWTY